jgi:hypothetical protein
MKYLKAMKKMMAANQAKMDVNLKEMRHEIKSGHAVMISK